MSDAPGMVIPNAAEFRTWLTESLTVLQMRPHRLGEVSGIGKNACQKFMTGVQVDLRLNTASALVRGAREQASEKGVELPPLPDGLADTDTAATRAGGAS